MMMVPEMTGDEDGDGDDGDTVTTTVVMGMMMILSADGVPTGSQPCIQACVSICFVRGEVTAAQRRQVTGQSDGQRVARPDPTTPRLLPLGCTVQETDLQSTPNSAGHGSNKDKS